MTKKKNEILKCYFEVDILASCRLVTMLAEDSSAKKLTTLMPTCGGNSFLILYKAYPLMTFGNNRTSFQHPCNWVVFFFDLSYSMNSLQFAW